MKVMARRLPVKVGSAGLTLALEVVIAEATGLDRIPNKKKVYGERSKPRYTEKY